MEQAIIELLKSAPEAAAILVVVIVFLRAQAHRDRAFEAQQERWNRHWSAQVAHSAGVVQENSTVLGEVKQVLNEYRGNTKG